MAKCRYSEPLKSLSWNESKGWHLAKHAVDWERVSHPETHTEVDEQRSLLRGVRKECTITHMLGPLRKMTPSPLL